MKKILSICLSAILATVILPRVSAQGNRSVEKHDSITTSASSQDIVSPNPSKSPQVQEFGNKKILTEIRTGLGVTLRAIQLRKKNKGFAKAYDTLIKRGRQPLFEKAGVTVLAIDISQSAIRKTALSNAQQIVEGDYEMSFFPVDSGNPDIWEG